jgi:tetratricopeptide (TPR) repeat protein
MKKTGQDIGSGLTAPVRWTKGLIKSEPAKNPVKPASRHQRAIVESRRQGDSVAEARKLLQAKSYRQALATADRVIKVDPQNADALAIRGDCLHQMLRFQDACYSYRAALAVSPGHYLATRGFGFSAYHVAKQMQEAKKDKEAFDQYRIAIDLLRRAITSMPGDAQVTYGIGLCSNKLSDYLGARAIRLRDTNHDLQGAETMYNLAGKLCREGIEALTLVVRNRPRDTAVRSILGNLYLRQAVLHQQFQKSTLAAAQLQRSALVWQSILQDINPNHTLAKNKLDQCRTLLNQWRAQSKSVQEETGTTPGLSQR